MFTPSLEILILSNEQWLISNSGKYVSSAFAPCGSRTHPWTLPGSWAAQPGASSVQAGPQGRAQPSSQTFAGWRRRTGMQQRQWRGNRSLQTQGALKPQTLLHPKPHHILNPSTSQALLHPKTCHVPAPCSFLLPCLQTEVPSYHISR